MANLTESQLFEAGIYQLETTDPVVGGPDGIANQQAKQLANRTAYLKKHVDDLESGATVPPGIATQTHVANELAKLDHKQSVRVATTANISLTGEQTIDGVTTSASRVLVKNQTTQSQNGIYVSSASGWVRASDADGSGELTSGMVVAVEEGTTQGNTRWQLTTDGAITLGTTSLVFANITAGFAPLQEPRFTGGFIQLPPGTTAQRPASPVNGMVRLNTTLNEFEGYNNGSWGTLGGGATGAPGNKVFHQNDQVVTGDHTIPATQNAMSAGPISIDTGVTVTISTGAVWTIV